MDAWTRKVLPCCVVFFEGLSWGQTIEKVMSSDQMRGMHSLWDSDADGQVSFEEAFAYVQSHRMKVMQKDANNILKVMDTDKDGRLGLFELKEDWEKWDIDDDSKEDMENTFNQLDFDKDGLLEREELPQFFSYDFKFRKYDSDRDGALSFREWRRGVQKKQQEPLSAEAEKAIKKEGKEIFRRLDMDGSKDLSPEEFFGYDSGMFAGFEALKTLYSIADTDSDSRLSADEMEEVRGSPKFANSAPYHHLKAMIRAEEEAGANFTPEAPPDVEAGDIAAEDADRSEHADRPDGKLEVEQREGKEEL